jgi:excisionase family DNA binding protein
VYAIVPSSIVTRLRRQCFALSWSCGAASTANNDGLLLNHREIILHAGGDPLPIYLQGVHMHVMERLMPIPRQIPQLVTLGEAADRLAVSKRHLQRLVARGELPTVRVGECVRISVSVLIAYIASQTRVG